MSLDISKFLARFADEAREQVARLNEGLLKLEKNPDDQDTVNTIFRAAHTIKGSSRMMKLVRITEVAHAMEDVLAGLRDRRISLSRKRADLLFIGLDAVSAMIETASGGGEITADNSQLCEDLRKAAAGELQEAEKEQDPPAEEKPASEERPVQKKQDAAAVSRELKANLSGDAGAKAPPENMKTRSAGTIRVDAEKLDELVKLMGEIVSGHNRMKQRAADVREAERTAKRSLALIERLEAAGETDLSAVQEVREMARLLGSRLKQLTSGMSEDIAMHELFTRELREKSLMLRMVPLSTVFDALPRMVRDLAGSVGKKVDLVVVGGEIELDKKLTEKVRDPIIHMIRNAVDHGIETPEARLRAGKSEKGTVSISACYEDGKVFIEIRDDGAGISRDRVREKALRKKMFSESELGAMSDSELVELVFLPGFSTSTLVTDVSGRGVGMDLVRKNIVEELGGVITTTTEEGKGTVFLIRLPLTLAIVRLLLFTVSETTLAFPAYYVREIIRVRESELISVVDKKAVRLRDELIPVVTLKTLLGLPEKNRVVCPAPYLLITVMGNAKLGLIVDGLLDEEDMVIKPLPGHMKNVRMVTGVTISGKNEIINILHLPAIVEASREVREKKAPEGPAGKKQQALRILVVDDSLTTRDIEKSILESHGYMVDLAGDGLEGLEKAGELLYDVIITDIEMPRMDGFSMTQRLRADQRYKDTPIIIVTSREKEEDKKRGISVGADAYIVKGDFNQSNLLETVQNLAG